MASLLSFVKNKVEQAGSATYHGLNPIDNGQGWTNKTPVRTLPPNVQQALTHPKYGPLVNNPGLQNRFINQPANKFNPLTAGVGSFKDAAGSIIVHPITRAVPEIAGTVLNKPVYHPGTRVEKALFGNTPVQNIQTKVAGAVQQHGPLAGFGEGLASVGMDLPAIGALAKGTKIIGKPAVGIAVKGVQKAAQDIPEITALKAQKAASIKAMDTATPKMMKQHVANVNSIDKQIKDLQQRGGAKAGDILPNKAFGAGGKNVNGVGGDVPKKPNMRQFEYTDKGPLTPGEKQVLAGLKGNQVNADYTAASNELRKLAKESGQPELHQKVMNQIASQKMPQAEATSFIRQGLDQMRSSGTNAKIRMGAGQNPPNNVMMKPSISARANLNTPNPSLSQELTSGQPSNSLTTSSPALLQKSRTAPPSKAELQSLYKTAPGMPKLPSEFDLQVTQQLTQKVPKDLGATKNPLVGKVEVPAAHDAGQAHLNAQFVAGHEQRVGSVAQAELAKLSPKDQNLMRGIQINGVQKLAPKAENPSQFVKTEAALRNYYDLRHAYDQSLGIPTPYRQNYLRDIIPKPEVPGTFPALGGNKAPGYTLPKTQPGVTPVAEGLAKDIAGSSFNHAKLTYAKGLEEAYPNKISRGSPIVGPEGVTQQLTTPYGNELFATKDLANKVNERGVSAPATGALGKYDTVNAFMKYVKLSGGAFHAFTEAGNFAGQQLMSGKLFTEPTSMGKVFKTFLSQKSLDKEAATLRANGTLDKAELSGLTWTPKAIKADVNVTPHGTVAKYTGIKALHDATFGRELPYIKLKTFEQKTQGLDIHNPEDLARSRSIARGINSEIGGQNRLLEGSLTPKQARVTARFLLATDFTEGKVRTVVSALSKGGEEGKLAREVVAGKALVFAGLATGGAALSGELKGKSPTQIAENVLKNFADPSWTSGKNTVSLPATHISEFTKPFKSFGDGSKDKFYGLKHYGSSRLAAVPSEITQLTNNMDYTGNHIYGKNTKKNGGQPISSPQTAVNVAKGVLPIPFSQGTSAVQGKQSLPATVGNIAGLRIYPTPTKKSTTLTGNTGNRALTKRQQRANNPNELTRWQGLTSKARTNVRTANPDKYIRDQQLKVQQEQAQGKTTQAFKDSRDIARTQITRAYDKNVVGAYGLNATDFKAFVAQSTPTQLNQLHSLDSQLVNAGLAAKSKFPKAKGSTSGGSRVSSSRKSGSKSSKAFTLTKISAKKLPAPKGVKIKKVASGKSLKTRKLAVYKIPKIKLG